MYRQDNPGGENAIAPPDSMPNSEVKCCNADGSVGIPHVRVGHCQVLNLEKETLTDRLAFFSLMVLCKKLLKNTFVC